jgi:hypothetical protein
LVDGDFNLDGAVNPSELSRLAMRWNASVPASAALASLMSQQSSSPMLLFRHMDASQSATYSPLDEESQKDQIVLD